MTCVHLYVCSCYVHAILMHGKETVAPAPSQCMQQLQPRARASSTYSHVTLLTTSAYRRCRLRLSSPVIARHLPAADRCRR